MSSSNWSSNCVSWLIRMRSWLLLLAVVLAGVAAPTVWKFEKDSDSESIWPGRIVSRLEFDRSIENMFAPDDPLLVPYGLLKRTFGGNEIVMATYVDDDLFSPEGIAKLIALREELSQVKGVQEVLTIDRLMGPAIAEPDNPLAERFRNLFDGYTHRTNPETGKTACAAVCMLDPNASSGTREEAVGELRKIIEPHPQGALAGEPVMVVDGFRYLEEDGKRLGFTSTILLMLTIAISFRSIRWMVIPLVVVQLTLLLTKALLIWLGLKLSMVSSMLTAIVTVVGVATVIHVIVRFRDAREAGEQPKAALQIAGTILLLPIFWACSTDAVGFGSLLKASVGPVRDFGLMMAVGSLLVLLSAALVVPGLALAGKFDKDPRRAWGEGYLSGALRRLLLFVYWKPKTLALVLLGLAGLIAAGGTRLQLESDFTRNFRENSPVVRSYAFVETNLGGAGVWDVVVPAPESLNWEYLSAVLKMEDRLRKEVPELTKVISLADAVKAGAPIDLDRVRNLFRRPMVNTALTAMQTKMPGFYAALYGVDPDSQGQHYLRIMLRAHERQTAESKLALINAVTRITQEEFAEIQKQMPEALPQEAQPKVTGFFVLLTSLVDSMLRDQWTTFSIAMAGIGLMLLIALRSLKLALVAMIPNALPILVVMGMMGWLGLKINMGAAMIAAVSLGLSVDSSLHYLIAYKKARRAGNTLFESLEEVQQTVGRALVFATLALIVGFSALCFSEFVPTIYFGALVSLAMIGGLGGNLLLLPLLLRLVEPEAEKS